MLKSHNMNCFIIKCIFMFFIGFSISLHAQQERLWKTPFDNSFSFIEKDWLKKNISDNYNLLYPRNNDQRYLVECSMEKAGVYHTSIESLIDYLPFELYEKYYLNSIKIANVQDVAFLTIDLNRKYLVNLRISLDNLRIDQINFLKLFYKSDKTTRNMLD